MLKETLSLLAFGLAIVGIAQTDPASGGTTTPVKFSNEQQALDAERNGIQVRIKDVGRFRGVRRNQLLGYGLIVGLEGTGDSRKTPFTQTLLANAMKSFGTMIEPGSMEAKNIATVAITAELPPFASPGNSIDITVQSIGDAKSLQGGYLLQAPLFGANDKENAIAVAQGAISIGGFNVSAGGNKIQKNHVNVGRIPGGAIVERVIPYQLVYSGKMFVELDEGDLTTANRIATRIREVRPEFNPVAIDGGTIQIDLPNSLSPVQAMSLIEMVEVKVDIPAMVIVNERTGTIAMGANVRLGPAVISQGSLQIIIEEFNEVSQPGPFSNGRTRDVTNQKVDAVEDTAQVGLLNPVTTIADLARVFQALKVTPRDAIAILQALKEQGSLKARLKIQ
ncbi:MAG: flagellar basal body P-ring protein FlgI [Fimbriimonadaceae bacterium]|nr:flagellar basal body P-ring protein FlgI [Fimbriimonadaceae bacterium]